RSQRRGRRPSLSRGSRGHLREARARALGDRLGGAVAHALLEAEAEEAVPVVVEEVPVARDDLVADAFDDVALVVERERLEAREDELVAGLPAEALLDADLALGGEQLDAR